MDDFDRRGLEAIKKAAPHGRTWSWSANEFVSITGLTLRKAKLLFYNLRAAGWFKGRIVLSDDHRYQPRFDFEDREW